MLTLGPFFAASFLTGIWLAYMRDCCGEILSERP
jgi:hypothetical protein